MGLTGLFSFFFINFIYSSNFQTTNIFYQIPVVMKDCASPDNTSCMKEWYTVRSKVSDVFYKLGCSSKAVAAEVKTAKVFISKFFLFLFHFCNFKGTGEHWVYYCKGDYCNSSTMFQPLLGLVLLAAFWVIKQ